MEFEQALVKNFHEKYGFARDVLQRRMIDREGWLDLGLQRFRLISEEFHTELVPAWHARDITALADALGDLAYVVLGTAVACGIEIGPLFREIHRSNMTKDVGQFKPVKGQDYQPPQLRPLLIAQGFTIKEL